EESPVHRAERPVSIARALQYREERGAGFRGQAAVAGEDRIGEERGGIVDEAAIEPGRGRGAPQMVLPLLRHNGQGQAALERITRDLLRICEVLLIEVADLQAGERILAAEMPGERKGDFACLLVLE